MPIDDIETLVRDLRASREFLMRHLRGLADFGWDYKPEAAPRSIREIVSHLIDDDAQAIANLGGIAAADNNVKDPIRALEASSEAVIRALREQWKDDPSGAEKRLHGDGPSVATGVTYLQIEDYYHAGQIAWLRLGIEEDWDQETVVYAPWNSA